MVEAHSWLIVGLGNPGPDYAAHRHNVGFLVAQCLAERLGAKFGRHRGVVAQVATGRMGVGVGAPSLVLAKPTTYMNRSGAPVVALAHFYKIPSTQIIAVHDDLDLAFGQLRAKLGGGEGGHNGLRSISTSLGTKDYLRARFGIGRPPGRQEPADFVLTPFNSVERKDLELYVERCADLVESLITKGLEPTQNAYHAPIGG